MVRDDDLVVASAGEDGESAGGGWGVDYFLP